MKKKIIAIMLTLTICAGLSACGSSSGGNSANDRDESMSEDSQNTSDESEDQTESDNQLADAQEESDEEGVATEEAKRADGFINDEGYYVFGMYEQDNDESNGPEPIEWVILDENENGTLLLSRYLLDCVQYNNERADVTWETCSLRSWMNNDFYNTAFSDEEKLSINAVNLVNEDNPCWDIEGGNDTSDRIFALSVSEIVKYFSFNNWRDDNWVGHSEALITPATEYAQNLRPGVYIYTMSQEGYDKQYSHLNYSENCMNITGGEWWLRSPGNYSSYACVVTVTGDAGWGCRTSVSDRNYGVRPALYITK